MDDRQAAGWKPNPLFWILIIVAVMLAIVGAVNHQQKLACLASLSVEQCVVVPPDPVINRELAETGLVQPPWDRAEWREERALISQVQTAWAATLAAGVAVFSLLLTAIGVYFLRLTLRETSETLKEARRTTAAAEQNNDLYRTASSANLSVVEIKNSRFFDIGEFISFESDLTVINSGVTIAQEVNIKAMTRINLKNLDQKFDREEFFISHVVSPKYLSPGQSYTGEFSAIFLEEASKLIHSTQTRDPKYSSIYFKDAFINVKVEFRFRTAFGVNQSEHEYWFGLVESFGDETGASPSVRWRHARELDEGLGPTDIDYKDLV